MTDIPPCVHVVINDLVRSIEEVIPGLLNGVYLTGSIPLNDFHPNKSDIDFVVLCQKMPNEEEIGRLRNVHQKIQSNYKYPVASGFYITKECLRLSIGQPCTITGVHEGKVGVMRWGDGLTAVTLKELKTTAYTFYGIPAQTLPIEVSDEELDHALFENMSSYWRKWIRRHTVVPHRFLLLLLFPWFTEWAVLGVARQLYTLQTGKVTSKLKAGEYALDYLPPHLQPVVHQAIITRRDFSQFHFAPSWQRATQTITTVHLLFEILTDFYFRKYTIRRQ